MLLASLLFALAPQEPVGINLETVTDWHQQTPFVDAFKSSRKWISHQAWTHPNGFVWGGGPAIDTDELGWPQSLQQDQWIESIIFSDGSPNYPDGIYNIRYEGVGTILPLAGGNGSLTIVGQSPGHIQINLTVPSDGYFTLRITDIVQPIKNIRVYPPGYDNSSRIFHPDFMKSLEPFDTIRFMNWGRTNDNPVVNWYDETNFFNYTQATSQGVHPLYMIDLCNKTCKNMWICVPHKANDLYVQYLALLCRIVLDPSLTIYLEYSNEVWNGIFDQCQYAQNEGMALGLHPQPWHAGWRFYSQRSVEVFNIFSNMYEVGGRRLVRVLAGQSVNPWVNRQIMDWQDAYKDADAFAVAPYFGGSIGNPSNYPQASTFTVPYLLSLCQLDLVDNHIVYTRQNKLDTEQRGLRLFAYEGGQHLVGVGAAQNNQTLTNLFVSANRDSGMRQLYYNDLDGWFNEGGQLFMLYRLTGTHGRYGSFGLLEWQTQPKSLAPKWLGTMDFINR